MKLDIVKQKESFWLKQQNKILLDIFKRMSRGVEGYKKFLKQARVNYQKITNLRELSDVPVLTKQNYFKKFSVKELSWHRSRDLTVYTATSGSTGEPTYFGRSTDVDYGYSVLAEFFYANGKAGSTLVVDCFGMGIWIGGVITYQAFYYLGQRGYPLSIITPGINKKEIFGALRDLGPHFDNVILTGYPPFIKDILDEARSEGVDFKKFRTRIIFAAESFTESFRDYIAEKAHIRNPYLDTLNIYGSAELGAMAFETPLSIFLRRLILKESRIYSEVFAGGRRLPTLAQYNPKYAVFEERNGEILISGDSSYPMFRYAIGDAGGVFSYGQIKKIFAESGINLEKKARQAKIPLTQLPFVFVYERSDFTVSFYGANIFPQHIKQALLHKTVRNYVTGKFVMAVRNRPNQDEYLEINVELAKGEKISKILASKVQESIVKHLVADNSEFANNYSLMPERNTPEVILWVHGHETHFKTGIKQKWKLKK